MRGLFKPVMSLSLEVEVEAGRETDSSWEGVLFLRPFHLCFVRSERFYSPLLSPDKHL